MAEVLSVFAIAVICAGNTVYWLSRAINGHKPIANGIVGGAFGILTLMVVFVALNG